jgi:hypothetical protein
MTIESAAPTLRWLDQQRPLAARVLRKWDGKRVTITKQTQQAAVERVRRSVRQNWSLPSKSYRPAAQNK